ncbi:hypothetical protein Celaphus_00019504, partial [Cervus elaphus hippelaphus]
NILLKKCKNVIQWYKHHRDDPPPEGDENKEKQTDDNPVWDTEYLKVSQGTFFKLTTTADYLNMKDLLDIIHHDQEEILKPFNIRNDFTEEAAAQEGKENQWREDTRDVTPD